MQRQILSQQEHQWVGQCKIFVNLNSLVLHYSENTFIYAVTDAPGKPEVLDVTKNRVTLVWSKPKNDGGSKIIGYYVEALKIPGDNWVRCNTSSQNVPREEYTVSGLDEGAQYQFRVIAKTAINISRPSEVSDPILVSAENGGFCLWTVYFSALSTVLNCFILYTFYCSQFLPE